MDENPPTENPPSEKPLVTVETREEKRVRRFLEGKARQVERTRSQEAIKKARQREDKDYARLTPEKWKEKYGYDKPKIGLIDESTAVRQISRRMTALALHTLAHICENSENHSARVSAAKEILDRGWGKTHLITEHETRPASEITVVFGNQQLLEQVAAPSQDDDDAETADPGE